MPWAAGGYALPRFYWVAIGMIVPAALVTIAEHLGDVFVLAKSWAGSFTRSPGLTRTLLGTACDEPCRAGGRSAQHHLRRKRRGPRDLSGV